MARPVKVRRNYARDAAELSRLAEAVERDPHAENEWKKDIMERLYTLAGLLTKETLKRVGTHHE